MPKRISPKFCARRWSQIPKLSYVVPNPSAKLGLNEPWPECQPELFQNDAATAAADGGGAGTTHPSWQVQESITHRDQISRSGIPHSDIVIHTHTYIIIWHTHIRARAHMHTCSSHTHMLMQTQALHMPVTP